MEQAPLIEIVNPEEWAALKGLRLKALKTDPAAFGSSYEQTVDESEEFWRKTCVSPGRSSYVAKIDGRMVAMAGVRLETGGHVQHIANLIAVFTDPEFRNRGIGRKLLEKILEDLHADPKIAKVKLSVNDTEEAAKALYKKLGFVPAGLQHKEMKSDGVYYDQVQMELIFEDKL